MAKLKIQSSKLKGNTKLKIKKRASEPLPWSGCDFKRVRLIPK
jgi:hypothetical protein